MTRLGSGPAVVVVGRPNVGKSTLFNRITGTRRSIVAPIAGTTRDALEAPANWRRRDFRLIDTGGLFGSTTDPLHDLVVKHGLKAILDADVVIFVVDGREGLVPGDEAIAKRVHALGVPVVVAVNKTDDKRSKSRALEFYQLGLEPIIEIAAEHGDGVADLLDEVVARLPAGRESARTDAEVEAEAQAEAEDPEIAVAIVGRPNVGKSSLVNRLLREERVLVSEMPGTTRDSIDVLLQWHKKRFRIVDTAGMRKPGRVGHGDRAGRAGERGPGASGRWSGPTSWCSWWTRSKAPGIAKAPSPGRPRRPAVASSSPSTSGTWSGPRDRSLSRRSTTSCGSSSSSSITRR